MKALQFAGPHPNLPHHSAVESYRLIAGIDEGVSQAAVEDSLSGPSPWSTPQTKVERESGGVTVVSSPLKEPLSQNLFSIEFSRNCLSDMEKWARTARFGPCAYRVNGREWARSRPAALRSVNGSSCQIRTFAPTLPIPTKPATYSDTKPATAPI